MTVHSIADPSNDDQPLFSCITALYTLTLLYFPRSSLSLLLVLTCLILLLLLRLGSAERQRLEETKEEAHKVEEEEEEDEEEEIVVPGQSQSQTGITSSSSSSGQVVVEWAYGTRNVGDPDRGSGSSFVGWDVGAPLEVIHEEGGDHSEGDNRGGGRRSGLDLFFGSGRYPSLSSYYPETDSDSSSEGGGTSPTGDWDSPGKGFFEWEAEDREESLIEIALNGHRKMDPDSDPGLGFHFEEENWIEIDPVKKKASSGFE